ncbi:MAG: YaiO family outer membrane beta-barrel protein [Bacteroidetes bacterium]|nr:YaiO family outer membrane beta-barrel protein [Bacteroidota bacterium]
MKTAYKFNVLALILLFSVLGSYKVQAQADSLFTKARDYAFVDSMKNRNKSKELCKKALKISPKYADVSVFLARLYSWDGDYDSARPILKDVIERDSSNEDAINAMFDVEYWSDHPIGAEDYANKGLNINPKSREFHIKKARAIADQKRLKDAITVIDTFLVKNPGDKAAVDLRETLLERMRVHKAGISYDIDIFSNTFTSPWHSLSLYYSKPTPKLGTVVTRLNMFQRLNEPNSVRSGQLEVDAYPSLSPKAYMYLNAGVSFDKWMFANSNTSKPFPYYLPLYRFGASYYRSLPRSFEGELGFRFLGFETPVIIFTGSLGWYYKNFWFSARPFITPNSQFPSVFSRSINLLGRWYYTGEGLDYFTIYLSTGLSPDDHIPDIGTIKGTPPLHSYKIRLDFQKKVGKRYLIGGKVADEYLELPFKKIRYDYTFGAYIDYLF